METLIKLRECGYHSGKKALLNDVNLDILSGKVNVLMGENGLGKSILMDLISGVIHPDEGHIQRNIPIKAIGYISQGVRMPYLLKTGEAIHYLYTLLALHSQHLTSDELINSFHPKVRKIVNQCQDQRSSQCSHGENKLIVTNLLILCTNFSLLVLDEPTSGLSPGNRDVFAELCQQAISKGMAILYSTHIESDIQSTDHILTFEAPIQTSMNQQIA